MEIRHEYDPVKAREYYLRTRELKGRAKATVKTPVSRPTKPRTKAAPDRAAAIRSMHERHAKQKAASAKRVAELRARLDKLKLFLKAMLDEAKAKSGEKATKDAPKDDPSTTKRGSGKDDQKTASEKAKAAKAAKEKYEKENPEAALNDEIKEVLEKIEDARQKLKDSVQLARGKAAVKTVSKRQTG